jgi:hypothetical protein
MSHSFIERLANGIKKSRGKKPLRLENTGVFIAATLLFFIL